MRPKNLPTYIPYGIRLISAFYLAMGIIGFLPIEAINPLHVEGVGARYLLHFMAITPAHNLIHLAIGASGLWAAQEPVRGQRWAVVIGVVVLLLFLIGMIQAIALGLPVDQLLLGLVALNSPGHTFHLVTGILLLHLGLIRSQAAQI